VRCDAAEASLVGSDGGADAIDAAAGAAIRDLAPTADIHGGADYRRRVARACVRRALSLALERARTAGGAA
jgi:CO/xanthine dehydrogenase FAD-binding subunit